MDGNEELSSDSLAHSSDEMSLKAHRDLNFVNYVRCRLPEAEVFVLNKTERSQPLRALAAGEGDTMVNRWEFSLQASSRITEFAARTENPIGTDTTVSSSG